MHDQRLAHRVTPGGQVDLALQDQDNFFIDLINWDINIARTSRQRLATSHIISSVLNKRVLSAL